MPTVAKLIDTTLCIGCKACEVACQQWNDLEFTLGIFDGTYQTMPDLAPNFWNLIKFNEVEQNGEMSWLMAKFQCMHCVDPGCLRACPAPGAIVKLPNGTVDIVQENCIGCGYCITGCPFDVPRLSPVTKKVYKCSLCSDRTAVGLVPACIKTCPTNCLTFGDRDELLRKADSRAATLKAAGNADAGVYNPRGCRRHKRDLRSQRRRAPRELRTASRADDSLVRVSLERSGEMAWLAGVPRRHPRNLLPLRALRSPRGSR